MEAPKKQTESASDGHETDGGHVCDIIGQSFRGAQRRKQTRASGIKESGKQKSQTQMQRWGRREGGAL